jgi:integrase
MPKVAKELSAIEVARINKFGFKSVGTVAGLGLQVGNPPTYSKSWVFRTTYGGKRRNIGLGSYPAVTLAMAWDKARKIKLQIEDNIDPINAKKEVKSRLIAQRTKNKTFKECTELYLARKKSGNPKHNKQWRTTLETYAYPHIGNILVKDIELAHIKEVLDPIWHTITETAVRVRGRMQAVIDFAITNEYRTKANPAIWKGFLDTQYDKPSDIKDVKNQESIPYSKMHDFMELLRKHKSISAKALEFLILTAVRSDSVRSATWSQIDLDERIWTIPKEFTKTKQEHKVPLSDQAIALIEGLKRIEGTDLLFPSSNLNKLSDDALSKLMRDMRERDELKMDGVPHGFRATFSTWRLEKTTYPFELAEISLMHKVGDKVAQTYQRGDGLERRFDIMQDWATFINSVYVVKTRNVVNLRKIA